MDKIAVLIPCYNEEKTIGKVVRDARAALPEAVDLGLPSRVKWASFNLGATAPEERGDYYAWGETFTHYFSFSPLTWDSSISAGYSLTSYRFNYMGESFSKYTGNDYATLQSMDDAATTLLGDAWRMPTIEEISELIDYCIWEDSSVGGVLGKNVTGYNGNSIFIPLAGGFEGRSLKYDGTVGILWSSSLGEDDPIEAYAMAIDPEHLGGELTSRVYGFPIRPVME